MLALRLLREHVLPLWPGILVGIAVRRLETEGSVALVGGKPHCTPQLAPIPDRVPRCWPAVEPLVVLLRGT